MRGVTIQFYIRHFHKHTKLTLWLIHTARDRDRDQDWDTMGFYIMLYTVHTTQRQGQVTIVAAHKRSLGQGNVFTPVCHSVHTGGWLPSMHQGSAMGGEGESASEGVCIGGSVSGVLCIQGRWTHTPKHYGIWSTSGQYAPTGMHSCFLLCPSLTLSWSRSRSCTVCISHNANFVFSYFS